MGTKGKAGTTPAGAIQAKRQKPGPKGKDGPELRARLRRALLLGATLEAAANYAGISRTTLYRWQSEKADFGTFVEACSFEMEVRHLRRIAKSQDWRAKAWVLERRRPADFGSKSSVEHTGAVSLQHELAAMSDAELARLEHSLAADPGGAHLLESSAASLEPVEGVLDVEPVVVECNNNLGRGPGPAGSSSLEDPVEPGAVLEVEPE